MALIPIIQTLNVDNRYFVRVTKVVSHALEGLPDGFNKVTTYGSGGGFPIWIQEGILNSWSVGGGGRDGVFGNTYVFTTRRLSRPFLNFRTASIWAFRLSTGRYLGDSCLSRIRSLSPLHPRMQLSTM